MRSPRPASAQFARFLVVGAGNTALSFAAYTLLVEAGAPYWAAGPLAFAAGAVNGYLLNRSWTFGAADSPAARLRYLAVQLCGLGATTGCLWLLVTAEGVQRLLAYALTIPLVTVATFAANRSWTFVVRV